MDLIEQALDFEARKGSFKTRNEKIIAAKEVKQLILDINEIYKKDKDPELMDLMKRLTEIKKKLEKRLIGRLTA